MTEPTPQKILVISLSNLGDAILTYPAIAALCAAYPGAQLHVLASPRTKDLFQNDPRFSKVWLWEKKAALRQISLVGRLFLERYQRVVDFRNTLIPLFLLGARRTPMVRRFLNRHMHRIDLHLKLLERIGVFPDEAGPLPYRPMEEQEVAQWIKPDLRCVVMAPGARSHLKRWSSQRFAELADRLSAQQAAQVILVGGPEDRPIAQTILAAMQQPALDLTGKTSLPQLVALLKRAQLVVTNDSACLHAAQAMGAPTLALFGPTEEKKYGPRLANSMVVRRRLVCAPCEKALCQYNHECMTGLETQEVYDAAVRVLRGS